jgi:hypothetical protein
MAKLYISEYSAVRVSEGGLAQVGKEPAIEQTPVTFTSATLSAAFGDDTRIVRLVADADAWLLFGDSPVATANSKFLPANVIEYFGVNAGQKVSVYDGTT